MIVQLEHYVGFVRDLPPQRNKGVRGVMDLNQFQAGTQLKQIYTTIHKKSANHSVFTSVRCFFSKMAVDVTKQMKHHGSFLNMTMELQYTSRITIL